MQPHHSHFTYDERNLPTHIGDARYRYNAEGHRYYSEVAGVHTVTIMDGDRNVGSFRSTNGTSWQMSYWNIHGNGLEGRYDNPNVTYHKRFYHKDHLGSTRVVVDQSGTVIGSYDYFPFGLEMPGRSSTTGLATRQKFTGHQRDEEVGLDYMVWRRYNPAFPVFLSVDPLASAFPGWSPYTYALNNPLIYVDPDGRRSTHTDSTGAVIAVYDDGDLGVYQHSDLGSGDRTRVDERRAQSGTTSGNGTRKGKTETWDEFAAREGSEQTLVLIDPSTKAYRPLQAKIMFGKNWDPVLLSMNRAAQLLDPINLAFESTGGGYFDLKTSAQYGMQGRSLGGYYTSSRSAGNFLAGMNARTAGFSFETFQRTAGGLHRAGKVGAARAFLGKEYGSPPMYGEIEIQYRWSLRGYHGQLRW